MEHLLDGRVFHQRLEPGCHGLAAGQANAADVVVVVADLHQAQPVTAVDQPHRLGVDRQGPSTGVEARPLGIEVPVKHSKTGWRRQATGAGGRARG